ncbi:Trp biosynthesis-associated membrane protein [Pseudonocardia sp. CA-107938]|uniref:Trp biosynthesis-associated membrane protein n=1 Tax=Pseudonocardia sp. CA-107938 TaxID=3240021 RepID=UPI003D8FA787
MTEPARSGRTLAAAAAGLVIAALLVWGAAALPWPAGAPSWTGGVALLALAGVAGVVATAGVARRAVGAVLAVAGIAVLAGSVSGIGAAPLGTAALVGGGLLLIGTGALVAWREPRLARFGARYDRSPDDRPAADPDRAAWDALDAGQDPTATTGPPLPVGPCRTCGGDVRPVFALSQHHSGEYRMEDRGDDVVVGICTSCGTGEARHRDVDGWSAYPHGDEDREMLFAATLPPAAAARLRDGLATCPDPLRTDCPCPVHHDLRTFARGVRIDVPDPPERWPELDVALDAEGRPQFT